MRPGRLTPENRVGIASRYRGIDGFNEAGAINPGKPRAETVAKLEAEKLQ